VRGTTAGRRLIVLSLPFTAFGLLWALDPPVSGALGDRAGTAQALGWGLAGLGTAAIIFGAYLLYRGDEKIV
jgi:MFS family permease